MISLRLLRVGDHEVALALLQVVGEVAHRERLVGHEAMAARDVAALDVAEGEGNHDAVEQRHDPVDRAGRSGRRGHPSASTS